MKKFQVLFAMLFTALTISLTSCSDDATSTTTPVSAFTKSATQPDSYMPLNQANSWTYMAKIGQVWINDKQYFNYTNDIVCNAFNNQKTYKVFSTKDGVEWNNYEQSNQIWELQSTVGTIEIAPFYNSRYVSANNGVLALQYQYKGGDDKDAMYKSYDITSTKKFTKFDLCNYPSLSTYDEKITIAGQTFDCVVVSTQENSSSSNYELTYFAKGYGLVKWVALSNNVAFEEITLKSCSLK